MNNEEMAEPIGLPTSVLGLAPGAMQERDRTMVYVFDPLAEELSRKHSDADKAAIIGHAIAHEIGHMGNKKVCKGPKRGETYWQI